MIPPNTLAGLNENELKAVGMTVSVVVFVTPLKSAVMITGIDPATG
jgi:hypothetical protein